jgi:CBS domain-containing protein
MHVERVLHAASRHLITVGEDAPLTDAARELLRDSDADLVVVCDADKRMAGVISKTDVVREISDRCESVCTTAVSAVMTRTVVFCRPGDPLHDVWTMMKDRRLKNVPILDRDSRPIGVLSARDLLEVLLEEVEHEETLLRDYVMNVGHPRL